MRLTPDGRGTAAVSRAAGGAEPAARAHLRRPDPVRRPERPGRRLRLRRCGPATDPQPVADRAARREERGPAGRVRARAQERRRRARRRRLRLRRLDRQHLRRGPRRRPAARPSILRVPPGGGAPEVFARGRPQRHRARGRPGRRGLDRGEQPRQHRVPVRPALRRRRRVVDQGEVHRATTSRPPARAARPAHAGPRPRLAVLQPGPRRRARRVRARPRPTRTVPFVRRRPDEPGRPKLDCATLPPVEQGVRARTPRRWA